MGDLLAECSQQLRASSFEYETLLGASVGSVWQALGRHVVRQLTLRKGVTVPQLGKFGFYKTQTSTLPAPPVFLLADRFASTYGVVCRQQPPPAPLTATAEVNMAALGSDAGLGHEQTRRTLEAVMAFVGGKLRGGDGIGRLALTGVGNFQLDGRTLIFTFDRSFLRALMTSANSDVAPQPAIHKARHGAVGAASSLRRKGMPLSAGDAAGLNKSPAVRRCASLDGTLQASGDSSCQHRGSVLGVNVASQGHQLASCHLQSVDASEKEEGAVPNSEKTKTKKHHRDHRRKTDASSLDHSSSADTMLTKDLQILPRFLLPEPRVPVGAVQEHAQHKRAMQTAFEHEITRMAEVKRTDDQQNDMLAVRQRAVQLRDLQLRAEKTVARRDLNAFLNNQIEEKKQRARRSAAAAANDRCDYRNIKILPLASDISDDLRRLEKQKLSQRLHDQVAAKAALKKDRRALDQAEAAYFISKLTLQTESERQELIEQKRVEKEALVAGWNQQKAIVAQKKAF
ncbi:hypothetical protein BBJ28_00014234 [Nothophytophthora sp. Chile5]|nr:hypothetical protein BBJ28_00014234 [Nothophytophthora sp. Chile5]